MNLSDTRLSRRSQSQKTTHYVTVFLWNVWDSIKSETEWGCRVDRGCRKFIRSGYF